jgi:hypothetical protein
MNGPNIGPKHFVFFLIGLAVVVVLRVFLKRVLIHR